MSTATETAFDVWDAPVQRYVERRTRIIEACTAIDKVLSCFSGSEQKLILEVVSRQESETLESDDDFQAFLEESCEIGEDLTVAVGDLRAAYAGWVKDANASVLCRAAFNAAMGKAGFVI